MKNRILNKAGEMFLNLGFKSVTMDDIANELGVSKKTIYKFYSNKQKLVDDAANAVHEAWFDVVGVIKEQDYNPVKESFEIEKMSQEMFKNAKSSPLFQLKKYYPTTYSMTMQKEHVFFEECIKDNLKKGISEGYYREGINLAHYAQFYFALVFSVHEQENIDHQLEKDVLEYHIRAIATEKGVKELESLLKIN